jgi:hypothetical protein
MANIFKSRTQTREFGIDEDKPRIKDLTIQFFEEMKTLSQAQKINLLYSMMVGKRPDPNFTLETRLNRILFEQKYGKKIKHTQEFMSKKKFRWPFKWRSIMNKSLKKGRQVLVIYLNAKGFIETPSLHPIYSSDMIIIRNKPHQVDPRAFWRLGKYQCLIIKEIDRRPVSNLDYDEIKKRGDATDSDEFIIKAAMQAIIGQPKKKLGNKTVIIVIGILVLLAIAYFLLR